MKRPICIAIIGPTASGKSSLALQLAPAVNGELICMDSTTVYKGFDIGSSKPSQEDQAKIPHHLLDLLTENEPFSAGHFVQHADEVIAEIISRGKTPIIVGGTYFYLRALQNGMYPTPVIPADVIENIEREYFEDEVLKCDKIHAELKERDPDSAKAIHPNDRYRLVRALAILRTTKELPSQLKPIPRTAAQESRLWLKYAIAVSRHTLNAAIVRRTEKMIQEGIVEETRKIRERAPSARALQSIGYLESGMFLDKKLTEKQLRNEIIEKTRQLAKRQTTWLRSDSEIRYVDFRDLDRMKLEYENLSFTLQ
jgi:tRNA dimethylallyltransferase